MSTEIEYIISVHNTDDTLFRSYKANVVPHTGEYLFFPHFGAFKILSVIFHISDDAPSINDFESLMFVEVIIDLSNAANWEKDILKGHQHDNN